MAYSMNLQGVSPAKIFRRYMGIIMVREQENITDAQQILNFVPTRTPEFIEEFLCFIFGDLLPPRIAEEVQEKIKFGIRAELRVGGGIYVEGPVFIQADDYDY